MTLYHTKIVTKRDSSNILMATYIEASTPGDARRKMLELFDASPSTDLPEHMRRHIVACQQDAREQGGALAIATKSQSRTPGMASYTA